MWSPSVRRLSNPTTSTAAAGAATGASPANKPAEYRSWYHSNMMVRRKGDYRSYWGSGLEYKWSGVPLSDGALLQCVDNTNAKHIRPFKQMSERFMQNQLVGCSIHRVSLIRFASGREVPARQQLKPGTIYHALLFSRRQPHTRPSGLSMQFDKTAGILINDKRVPVGTRVLYCASRHINHKAHLKAAVLANFFI